MFYCFIIHRKLVSCPIELKANKEENIVFSNKTCIDWARAKQIRIVIYLKQARFEWLKNNK